VAQPSPAQHSPAQNSPAQNSPAQHPPASPAPGPHSRVRLPRVVVVGPAPAGSVALWALVDGGLPASALLTGPPGPARVRAEDYLNEHDLTSRVTWLPAGATVAAQAAAPGALPVWSYRSTGPDGAPITSGQAQAVVVVPPDPAEPGPVLSGLTVRDPRALFGSVFPPDDVGVYQLTGSGRVGTGGRPPARLDGLLEARARWLGEYLRGRYRLPEHAAMVETGGIATGHRRLGGLAQPDPVRWLAAECRRGRARAALAGYPLPLPDLAAEPKPPRPY